MERLPQCSPACIRHLCRTHRALSCAPLDEPTWETCPTEAGWGTCLLCGYRMPSCACWRCWAIHASGWRLLCLPGYRRGRGRTAATRPWRLVAGCECGVQGRLWSQDKSSCPACRTLAFDTSHPRSSFFRRWWIRAPFSFDQVARWENELVWMQCGGPCFTPVWIAGSLAILSLCCCSMQVSSLQALHHHHPSITIHHPIPPPRTRWSALGTARSAYVYILGDEAAHSLREKGARPQKPRETDPPRRILLPHFALESLMHHCWLCCLLCGYVDGHACTISQLSLHIVGVVQSLKLLRLPAWLEEGAWWKMVAINSVMDVALFWVCASPC